MWSALEATDGKSQFPAQLVPVTAAAVGKLASLEQVPDSFVGVELRSVAGQAFEVEAYGGPGDEEVLDGAAAMNHRSIPDDRQLARNLTQPLTQKGDDALAGEGLLLDVGEQSAPGGHTADHRQMVAGEGCAQDRCLPARRIGAGNKWQQIEAGLVYKDDRSVFFGTLA